MARLPQPGGDRGNWGEILNDYLQQSLTTSGQLKDNTVGTNQLISNSVTADSLAGDAVTTAAIADGSITETQLESTLQTKINSGVTAGSITNTEISPTAAIAQSKIANLETDLTAKANAVHTHVIADVTNLQTSLNNLTASALPVGGSTGQILRKVSGTNYDASWTDNTTTIPSSDSGTIAAGTWTLTDLSEKVIRATLGGNVTLALPTPGSMVSFSISLVLKQDATGSRTLTFPAGTKSPYNILPTLSTAANSYDVIQLWWDGAQWWAFAGALGAI